MKKVKAVLVGAGQRGRDAFGSYAVNHPEELQFVAVVEPDIERREIFSKLHSIGKVMCFESWEEMLERPKLADAMLICTQDKMHYEPAMKALERGYHLLLEKPMASDPIECIRLGENADKYQRVFSICHVLRYTPFFTALKKILNEGRIGRLISIQHNENVAYWHQAHSFVRGNWKNSATSSPMILAKCCHDMDILLWLADADCLRVSSFGGLTHFKKENAPHNAPDWCLDGCSAEKDCPYYAPRIYLTENTGWPASVISNDTSYGARMKALKEGPYGRCVYRCDNNVVDHQVVNLEFENEVTAAFTMCAFTNECSRTIKLMGTRGEVRGAMEKNEIEVVDFVSGCKEIISLEARNVGHGGGDYGIMHDFVRLVREGGAMKGLTSVGISVQSHLIAFAAEESRVQKKVVDMREYVNNLKMSVT